MDDVTPEGETPEREPDATPAGAEPAPASDAAHEPQAAPGAPATPPDAPADDAAPAPPPAPRAAPVPRAARPIEPPEIPIDVPRGRLSAQTRRAFLLFTGGVIASAAGAWWLLPDATRRRLLPDGPRADLDSLAARVGLARANRERVLDRALTFDDDVAEALYSPNRAVRTYARDQVTPLRNNYDGRTPGPEILDGWALRITGLAAGGIVTLTRDQLLARFALREQVTRLVCVEGWSAIAWWGGIRFADLLAAFPPAPGARWVAMRSSVNLDARGNPDPYYVSIDLGTARHPQTLLATHQNGAPLTLEHGAPLRLLAPVKLGLKNIKAVTDIAYTTPEPADYWNERGYSKYDGL
ncbi:MAG: molybdopterin-dependent oxidoreductase [Candidatus Eisenbacteria bacterium]|nr:molybdopterin-dependent oxidoreductase [Candidatus Eisenbacteria bacterium]